MIFGYCRISTLEPIARLEAQKHRLAGIGAQTFFCERIGFFGDTPQLDQVIEFAKKGDVVAITRPYRAARSTRGVLSLIERLGRKGAGLRILDTPIDTSTTTGRMILASAPLWSVGMSPLRSLVWDSAVRSWLRPDR